MELTRIEKQPLNITTFMILIIIFPLIDFLNGFFLSSYIPIPIGVIFRFVFFTFLFIMILVETIPKTNLSLFTFLFLSGNVCIFLFQSLLLQNSFSWILSDLAIFIKYFLWVLIPYYIYQRKKFFQTLDYEKMFIVISVLFTTLLIIPYLLGVGYQTYENSDAGYKGFFFANNDTSFAFIVSITFTAKALVQQIQRKWGAHLFFLLLLYTGNVLCFLLVSTKTGIIYGACITSIILFQLLFIVKYRSTCHKVFVWLTSLSFMGWIILRGVFYVKRMIAGTYERIVYFYYLYDGDLVRLLSSSRSDFLEGGFIRFLESPYPTFTMLFGQGFEYRLQHFGRLGLIEMDFFDAFFGLGLLGILLLVLLVGYYASLAMKKKSLSIYSYLLIVSLLYSFFAGHVLFSALSSTLLGLICGGIILLKKE
ncbi:hypothetical protein HB912_06735 [Listeria aquatica]|uniref:Uncharacterized protein n=1 Tax=Listeria aquatica TaxID=1494960 RepID=A0A841ZPR9_9LIST|nr:hypothetical protein [Listeria aquatica]